MTEKPTPREDEDSTGWAGADRRHQDRRQGAGDRRSATRGDRRAGRPGGRRATDMVAAGVMLAHLAAGTGTARAAERGVTGPASGGRRATDTTAAATLDAGAKDARPALALPLRFGTEVKSVARAEKAGLPFAYGVLWTGAWNQKYGWDTPRHELREARKQGVVPVVHWWYWGDEISPAAVRDGVVDARHQVRKDKDTWFRMAGELADTIASEMGGREAVVVLETEFNKNGIENDRAFDDALAEQARLFKSRGNIKVVLGFGNWGQASWGRFAGAAGASDMVGTQLLRSSVREPAAYMSSVDTLLSGVRALHQRFDKPVMVMDLALSTYPSADYEGRQAAVLRDLFNRMGELKGAGVTGLIWRQIVDDPRFDTSNYHGQAERHWGVLRSDGSAKPGFEVLRDGMRTEVAGPRTAGPTS